MLQKIFLLAGAIAGPFIGFGQTPTVQDCPGAIPVCQSLYLQPNSFSGTGNYPNEINNALSCLGGEINSVWYTFTVQTTGTLCFSITPNNAFDDYDWALFNLTNATCADIATNGALEVRCNFDVGGGPGGVTGATGLPGPGQEPCLVVNPGQTYVLNISNFSASQFGYSLQFSGTAAIFDNIPPRLRQVDPITACGLTEISFSFTENISCASFTLADLELIDPTNALVPLAAVTGAVCAAGGDQERNFTLSLGAPLTLNGTYRLRLLTNAGGVTDLCGNVSPLDSITFSLNFPVPSAGVGTFLSVCTADPPFSLLSQLFGTPTAGGQWFFVGTGLPIPDTFNPASAPSGAYRYLVGTPPCAVDSSEILILVFAPPDAGLSASIQVCSSDGPFGLITRLGGTPETGGIWTDPSGAPFGGAFTPGLDPPGAYTYTIGGQGGCPDATAVLQVQVSNGPQYTLGVNPPACAGEANGQITAAPIGPGPLFYQLLPGLPGPSGVFSNLPAGAYTLVVTSGTGCADTALVTLADPPLLAVAIDSIQNTTCAGPGAIFASAMGGTGAISFFLNGAGPAASGLFMGLAPGPYEVIAEDANGCRDTAAAVIANQNNLALSVIAFTPPGCNGGGNGQVTLQATGGTAPLGYSLDGITFFPTNTFSGLPGGPITFFAVDASGCQGQVAFTMPEPAPLSAVPVITPAGCTGLPDASVQINPVGGTGPYTFSADGLTFTPQNTFSNLNPGNYPFFIRDANNCNASITATVTTSTGFLAVVDTIVNPGCNGQANGQIFLFASGGPQPYAYSINGGPLGLTPVFSNLSAGTYAVRVIDVSSCEINLTVVLAPSSSLDLTLTAQSDVTCAGDSNGSISISALSPAPPFAFSIDGGITFQPTGTFSGLSGGLYNVIAEDGSGCRDTLAVTISEPPALNLFAPVLTAANCFGAATGAIRLEGTGGAQPYAYSLNGNPFSPTLFFPNLTAGTYQAIIRDNNSCLDTLDLVVSQPPALTGLVASLTQPACFGDSTGEAVFTATGGTGQIFFSLAGFSLSDSVVQGLPANSYQAIAIDQAGCIDTIDFSISQPPVLALSQVSLTPVRCFGENNGAIQLAASGGSPGYLFGLVGGAPGINPVVSGLTPGAYAAVVTDSLGCTDTLGFVITEPAALALDSPAVTQPLCAGTATGLVNLAASGGTAPYQFQQVPNNPVAGGIFLNLTAGNYLFAVIDSRGCADSVATTLTDPPALTVGVDSIRNVACFGNNTGAIFLSGQGGIPPYVFAYENGPFSVLDTIGQLGAGIHRFSVRDGNGCVNSDSVLLTQNPRLLVAPSSLAPIRCAGEANGRLIARGSGGAGPLLFSLNNSPFLPDSIFEPLGPGNYALVVRDALGCLEDFDFILSDPDSLFLRVEVTDVACFGKNNGRLSAGVSGGATPYTFSLNGGPFQVGSQFTGLAPGVYTVSVQDSVGCFSQQDGLEITEPDSFVVLAATQNPFCFASRDGAVVLTGAGGSPGFLFSINGGPFLPQNQFSGLGAGNFIFVGADANGCRDTTRVTLSEPDRIQVRLDSLRDAFCSFPNGFASVSISGGTGDVQVSWSLPGLEGLIATNLPPNDYSVLATDANGCTGRLTFTVGDDPAPAASFSALPAGDQPIPLSQANVAFLNQTVNGISYIWNFGDGVGFSENPDPVYQFNEPGQYTVVLTAFNRVNDCPDRDSLTFTIIPDGQIFIPNAFTPNGDSNNEVFRTFSEGMQQYELIIFDRWGKEIFRTDDPDGGWNGMLPDGQYAPEGVYAFLVRGIFAGGESIRRAGSVTLLR